MCRANVGHFLQKGGTTRGGKPGAGEGGANIGDQTGSREEMRVNLPDFPNCPWTVVLAWVPSVPPLFFFFLNGNVCNGYPMPEPLRVGHVEGR